MTVPLISIDDFLSGSGGSRAVRLIKIDVQGYELAVCRGMATTIAQQRDAVVAVEYMPDAMKELGYDAPAMLDWFSERGFKMYSLRKDGEVTEGLSRELGEKGYVDLIFSRTPLL